MFRQMQKAAANRSFLKVFVQSGFSISARWASVIGSIR